MSLARGTLLFGLTALLIAGVGLLLLMARNSRANVEMMSRAHPTATDEAWAATLPTLDPDVRARSWTWMTTPWPTPRRADPSLEVEERWYLNDEPLPKEVLGRHETERPRMAVLDGLLAENTCFSSSAWRGVFRRRHSGAARMPNARVCRAAARWYALESRLVRDPRPVLDRFDRFCRSLDPPAAAVDTLIAYDVMALRDRTYLTLVCKGVLSPERAAVWLAESSHARRQLLDCCRVSRYLTWTPIARDIVDGRKRARQALYGDKRDIDDLVDYLWHARTDVTSVVRACRRIERYLEGEIAGEELAALGQWAEEGGVTASLVIPNYQTLLWRMLEERTRHRLVRLVGLVRLLGMPAPGDAKELRRLLGEHAHLLDAGPEDLPITYERVDPDRARFFVSPDVEVPAAFGTDHRRDLASWHPLARAPFLIYDFGAEVELPR